MQITELTLYTNNISSVKEFYSGILFFKINSETPERISFQAGATELIFREDKSLWNPVYHFAFNIPANKIEQAKEWMEKKVSLLLISENNVYADFKNWNAKSIYFLDSVGNIAEFIARFDLRNSADKDFNSSQILSVSEIGIISDNVPAFKQKLISEYKVPDFVKSVNSDTFSAMGDDNGLFITVIENRNWYPTNIPSQKLPFEVKFKNDSDESFVLTDKTM